MSRDVVAGQGRAFCPGMIPSAERHIPSMAGEPVYGLRGYLFERRHVAGAVPNVFLKAREKAASEP
jgi:hypothetical protein